MKPLLSIASVLLFASLLTAAEPANDWLGKKVPTLTLSTGKTYSDVTFTKIEADAATITHAGGILRIPMESFNPEAQQALGYDPAKAAEARKEYETKRADTVFVNTQRAAIEKEIMTEKAAAEQTAAATYRIAARIVQVTEEGALCKITVLNEGGGGSEGDDLEFIEFDPEKHNVIDGEYVRARAIAMEKPYRYTSALGSPKTVRRWVLVE